MYFLCTYIRVPTIHKLLVIPYRGRVFFLLIFPQVRRFREGVESKVWYISMQRAEGRPIA